MLIGLVKWFNPDKGFGVIGTAEGDEIFLHINSFLVKPTKITRESAIIFSIKNEKLKNRNTAENSRLVSKPEDWKIICNYLDKPANVNIEVEIIDHGKRGNSYHRKEIQSFSLIGLATKQFFIGKNEIELANILTDYFDKTLDTKNFIAYCELIENGITKGFPNENLTILNKIFLHFGQHLNDEIVFKTWKHKKIKYISYTDIDNYEISESILKAYISEIGIPELRRIVNLSFGLEFCAHFINEKFRNLEHLSSIEIMDLYKLLEFVIESEKEKTKKVLDSVYGQRIIADIIEEANSLGTIKNNDDFNNYNRLLQLVPIQFEDEEKNKIKNKVYTIIASNCSEEFKSELWLKGIIEEAPFEFVLKIFLDKDTQMEKRISILSKLQSDIQFELLDKYSVEYNFEKAFLIIELLVKKENSLDYNFKLSEVLFNHEFWKEKKCNDIVTLFNNYVIIKSNEEQKYELFFKGYVKDVPQKIAYQYIHKLGRDECKKIFKTLPENKTFIKEILQGKITKENVLDIEWVYNLANEFLDYKSFTSFDTKVFNTIEQSKYFTLWKIGKAKVFPKNYIEEILFDNFETYTQINNWIENKATSIEEISNFLFSYLSNGEPVTDRKIFYKQLNHIKYLLQINEIYLSKIKQLQNDFHNIILWFLDRDEDFNYELLKQKFIYFSPGQQVRIIRKLFFLKTKNQFDLTVEKLNELTRFDLDLYRTTLNFNPEFPIDISTDVVIKALISYKQNQRFFIESELLTVILNDIKIDKTSRFRLSNYFENCLGRQTAKFDWSSEGEIKKINYGTNQFYFAISFSTGKTTWVHNRWGGRDVFTPNPNFENLKEAVKKLPGVKWNSKEKHWGVMSKYETEVLIFAKEQRFFLDFEGSNYANNLHFAKFEREDRPNGISFCEGRLANRSHETFKKEFWWCEGQPCFGKCETIHKAEEWENYTLLDFCEILGFNTDEINKIGDHIPKGHYYQFIALINRFNRLLEKIYCSDCNHILYPSDFGTGHFAAHTLVRFQCRNESCSNKDEIYLNHCLNGQCNCIIDSRVSKKCDNGLFICDNCGSCCSHEMFKRRLSNLELTGGYIHANLRPCVNEKLGHLERAEYFCFKCREEMNEVSNDIFQCANCNVEYNTVKYKIKRPHIHLKQKKTTTSKNDNTDNSNESENPF